MSHPCGCCGDMLQDCEAPVVVWQGRAVSITKCGFPPLGEDTGGVVRRFLKRSEKSELSHSDSDSGTEGEAPGCVYDWAETIDQATNFEVGGTVTLPPVGAGSPTTEYAVEGSASGTWTSDVTHVSGACGPAAPPFGHREGGTTRTYKLPADIENPVAECGRQGALPLAWDDEHGPDGIGDLLLADSAPLTTNTPEKQVRTAEHGTKTIELTDEYTTEMLIARAEEAIEDATWVEGNSGQARRILWADESTAGVQQRRYRFQIKIPNTCRALIRWKEVHKSDAGVIIEEQQREHLFILPGTRENKCYKQIDGYDPNDEETWPTIEGDEGGWFYLPLPEEPGSYWELGEIEPPICTRES